MKKPLFKVHILPEIWNYHLTLILKKSIHFSNKYFTFGSFNNPAKMTDDS